ncbi:MAG TPA: hypothetical protein VLI39_08665 [Sedimentisphaerales bacterium]|nr:hypothetical protein [Sedimentisphaerales bacterium]
MDEIGQKARPKRTRVLRATDIIPPFDQIPAPRNAGEGDPEPRESAQAQDRADSSMDVGTEDSGLAQGEVPRYDLAETILAEQRRVASRRRRAPSPTQQELPEGSSEFRRFEPFACELPSEDLPELQRIVAEIVARDIERLCRRPNTN